jgi:hypothetical protein
MTAGTPDVRSAGPRWGRFLLRLAAVAWPVLTYWFFATTRSSAVAPRRDADCGPLILALLLPVLTVLGVVALVCAAKMAGSRQRYALAIAAAIAAAWVVIAVVVRSVVAGTTCGLF